MKTVVLTVMTLLSQFGWANREGGGVGAPRFVARCFDLHEDFQKDFGGGPAFQVDVARFWPQYELSLSVLDRAERQLTKENVQESSDGVPGAAKIYRGEKLELQIRWSATPIFENGHTYAYGELVVIGGPTRALKCQSMGHE